VGESPELSQIPAAARMMADIEAIVGLGIRRPGYAADRRAEEWAARRFAEIGMENVVLEPVELPMWQSGSAMLEVWPTGYPAAERRFTGFALPYTRGCTGLERDLLPADASDVRDQVVIEPVTFIDLPAALLRDGATFAFDPDGDFDTLVQTLPFGPRFNAVGDAAVEAGAAGYVGVLTGLPWETRDYYVPYDARPRPISGLWLSRSDGIILQRMLAGGSGGSSPRANTAGPHRARLSIDCRTEAVRSHNVVGRLPGAGDETVIVGSHHDAPWASAVEDASGMALVLAQAAYWASVPAAQRPHNLTFVLTAGHMAGGAGARAFVNQHAGELDRVVLEVHLEHAAAEVRGDGERLERTGQPEPRWWFTSTESGLEAAVADALRAEDLRRSLVLKPTVFGEAPTTDGSAFYLAGVPIVHFLTAPMYLFDSADTIDKIHVPSLEPVTRAVIRIINSLRNRTATDLRTAVRED
jgi:Peptidase family M28